MTLRHLKIFVAVADCGSMSAAANKLYISQPTVSQAIAEIEKNYNIRLFERLSQKLFITDDGIRLLSYARHIIDSFESMELAMQNAGENSHLRIGCSVSVGTYLLNELLDDAEKRLNDCKVSVIIDNTSSIESLLLNNEIDVGIVEGIIANEDITMTPVCNDELVLICGKNHRLAQKMNIKFSDLEGENFISREKGSADRNQLEKIFEERKIKLNRYWSSTNTEAIKNAVIHGRGVAILSNMLIINECKNGDMVILNIEGMRVERTIHLIHHKNKYISDSIKTLIDICNRYDNK